MRRKTAVQIGIRAADIHSRDGVLFGHDGPRQQGRPPLSTKHPPCLLAWLSLPDEEESKGEKHLV